MYIGGPYKPNTVPGKQEIFLREDDCSDRSFVIYIVLFIYAYSLLSIK